MEEIKHLSIIDAHMHLWDYNSGNYPWLKDRLPGADKMIGNYDPIRKNFLVNDFQNFTVEVPVKKSVHIQVFGYPEDPPKETEWLQQQSDKYNFPHAVVGFVDFCSKSIEEQLQRHCLHSNMRGIRNVLSFHSDPDLCMIEDQNIMSSSTWRDGYQLLEKYKLSFDVQLYDHQLDELAKLVSAFPQIPVIINHIAWPTGFDKASFANWCDRIKMISDYPNTYIKLSGFGCIFKQVNTQQVSPYIEHCIKTFGEDRCVFGSNTPVLSLFSSYKELLTTCLNSLSGLSKQALHKVFYGNAEKFYRI